MRGDTYDTSLNTPFLVVHHNVHNAVLRCNVCALEGGFGYHLEHFAAHCSKVLNNPNNVQMGPKDVTVNLTRVVILPHSTENLK